MRGGINCILGHAYPAPAHAGEDDDDDDDAGEDDDDDDDDADDDDDDSYGADDDFVILSVRSYHPGCLAILLSLCGLNPLQSHAPPSTIIQGASNSRHLHHNHHLHHHHHHHHHHLYHNPGGIISFSFLRHNHNHHQSTMIHHPQNTT